MLTVDVERRVGRVGQLRLAEHDRVSDALTRCSSVSSAGLFAAIEIYQFGLLHEGPAAAAAAAAAAVHPREH